MKRNRLWDIVMPRKGINTFVVIMIFFGIISGSIFLVTLSSSDKNNSILSITNFINGINKNFNSGLALKNSLVINYLYLGIIFIMGFSVVGTVINIFLSYIKGFILGFLLSSMVMTYKYKAIPLILLYVFPSQVINIIVIMVMTIYSIMFARNLCGIIITNKNNNKYLLKRYLIIGILCTFITILSSLYEAYVFPYILKIIIGLYL